MNEPPGASTNESATESSGNSVDIDVNKGNSQVKATPRELENQVLSEVLNLLTAELPELEYEEVEDEDEDMSRLSKTIISYDCIVFPDAPATNMLTYLDVKAKTPSKTNSRPSLSHVSPKAPAELTGQASPKVTKEDAKYWKTREQELLEKISMLESKMGGSEAPKYYGPVDQVAAQRQEKLEEDLSVSTSVETD